MRSLRANTKLMGPIGLAIGLLCAGAAFYASSPQEQTALAAKPEASRERGNEHSPNTSTKSATLAAAVFSPAIDREENPLAATRVGLLAATQERPLFSASRRPPPPTVAAAPALPTPPKEPARPLLALVGVVAGEDNGFAIFRDEKTKAVVRLKRGESYSNWTLRQVQGRAATLERGSESEVIEIANPPAH
jgi:general secretion pathway protein N